MTFIIAYARACAYNAHMNENVETLILQYLNAIEGLEADMVLRPQDVEFRWHESNPSQRLVRGNMNVVGESASADIVVKFDGKEVLWIVYEFDGNGSLIVPNKKQGKFDVRRL